MALSTIMELTAWVRVRVRALCQEKWDRGHTGITGTQSGSELHLSSDYHYIQF